MVRSIYKMPMLYSSAMFSRFINTVINIDPIENAELATLTITDPDGNVTTYEEKDNQIVVNLDEAVEGQYAYTLNNIPGRSFNVLYSTGDTYYPTSGTLDLEHGD